MEKQEKDASGQEVYCSAWGYAKKSQLGSFKQSNFSVNPVLIEINNTQICEVAAGENHNLFTDSTSLFSCGSNTYGQLGIGEEEKAYKAYHLVKGTEDKHFEMLACGGEHSVALTTKGEVYSWGLNFKGQLGNGSVDNRYEPEIVECLIPSDGRNFSESKSSAFFMKRSKSKEQIKGKQTQGTRQRPSKSTTPDDRTSDEYKDLKPSKSVDLTNKKGNNNDNSGYNNQSIDTILMTSEKIVQIACGAIHTMALTNLNRVLSCGNGGSYCLGHGNRDNVLTFKVIDLFTELAIKVTNIACGMNHSGCITDKGKVYLWGITSDISFSAEMKDKCLLKLPTLISFSPDSGTRPKSRDAVITDLKLGEVFSIALSSSGKVYTWGVNELGQLGNGDDQPTAEPALVASLKDPVVKIGCGLKHCVVITSSAQMYAWGANTLGQLGVKTDEVCAPLPVHVSAFENAGPFKIVCGYYHNICLSSKSPRIVSLEDEFSLLGDNNVSKEEIIKLKQEVVRLRKQLLLQSGQIFLNSNLNDSEVDSSNYDEMVERQLVGKKKYASSMMESERQFHANFEINYKDLKFDKRISEGGYGIVHKGRWMSTVVAIKEIKKEIIEQDKLEEFRNECSVMEVIRHPNIVMFLGASTKPPHLCIVLEYCGRGSLWSCLHDMSIKISWELRKKIALDIAKGVLYLHKQTPVILHRDLKSLNILLDHAGNAKLADFGWTRIKAKVMTSKIGTYQWMAPEVIAGFKYTEKADVFSFGVILWELATRKPQVILKIKIYIFI